MKYQQNNYIIKINQKTAVKTNTDKLFILSARIKQRNEAINAQILKTRLQKLSKHFRQNFIKYEFTMNVGI